MADTKKKNVKGRTTVYNELTSPEKLENVNPDNLALHEEFMDYLKAVDKSPDTIYQYDRNLKVFWVWNMEKNRNKFFVDIKIRDFTRFQGHAIGEWKWGSARLRTVKASLSSLGNYIENILYEEYPDFRSVINKIESPKSDPVRNKTVFSDKQLDNLLKYLVKNQMFMKACMLSLAMNNGRRKAELTRFKVNYFNNKNLICDGALYKTPEKIKTKGSGSKGKMLTVYTLSKDFKPYLDMWIMQRKELGITSEWLFPKCVNGKWIDEPIGISLLNSWAKSFSEILGQPFYWHSMRHFFTTKLKSANIPDDIIQSLIGWQSSDMIHIYDDNLSEDQFDKYFGSGGIKQVENGSISDL